MLNLHKQAHISRNLAPSTGGEFLLSTVDFVGRRISFGLEEFDGNIHDGRRSVVGTAYTDEMNTGISALPSFDADDGENAGSSRLV